MKKKDLASVAEYFDFSVEPSCGTQCVTVGHTNIPPQTLYPANQGKHPDEYKKVNSGRSLKEFHLVYVPAGGGRFTNDSGNTITVYPGAIMLLPPGMPHAYSPLLETGWEEYWVGFKGSYPNWLSQEQAFSRATPLLSLGPNSELIDDFTQLCIQPMCTSAKDLPQQLGGIVNRLIGRLLIIQSRPAAIPDDREAMAVEKIKAFFTENLSGNVDMRRLPSITGLKYGVISQAFKRFTGMTPHQFYIQKKLEQAIVMLRAGKSVKEVSYSLGFDCPYYFSRLFSQKVGYAPSICRDHTVTDDE